MAIAQYTPPPASDEVWPPPEDTPAKQTTWERFSQKFKEEPLVPIGIFATCIALGGASSALQKGNRTQFNKFLRYRVAAQGLTVIAAIGGSLFYQTERQAVREKEKAAFEAAAEARLLAVTGEAKV